MRHTKSLVVLSAIALGLVGYGCGDGDRPEQDASRPLPGGNSDVGVNSPRSVEATPGPGEGPRATGEPSDTPAPGAAGATDVNRGGTDNKDRPAGTTEGGTGPTP